MAAAKVRRAPGMNMSVFGPAAYTVAEPHGGGQKWFPFGSVRRNRANLRLCLRLSVPKLRLWQIRPGTIRSEVIRLDRKREGNRGYVQMVAGPRNQTQAPRYQSFESG